MKNYLGVDYGESRCGLALAVDGARSASPWQTIAGGDDFVTRLGALGQEHDITDIVLGLPRGLEGQETKQTSLVRQIADQIDAKLTHVTLHLQDEALTSEVARARLGSAARREAGRVDQEAAAIILQDYLDNL